MTSQTRLMDMIAQEIIMIDPEFSVRPATKVEPMLVFAPEDHEADQGFSVDHSNNVVTITNLEMGAKFQFSEDEFPNLIAETIQTLFSLYEPDVVEDVSEVSED